MKNRIFALVLALSLTACTSSPAPTADPTPRDTTPTEAPTMQDAPEVTANPDLLDADPTPDPADPETAYFDELVAEYAKVDPPRTAGVVDGVAFWGDLELERFYLHDINANKTTILHNIVMGNGIYWQGNIYGILYEIDSRGGISLIIACYDMQGNLVREFQAENQPNILGILSDGSTLYLDAGGLYILSPDFTTSKKLSITVDVGHGKTEEITNFSIVGEYNQKLYVSYGRDSDLYTIDLTTGESQQSNSRMLEHRKNTNVKNSFIGKFYLGDNGIYNIETGETVASHGILNTGTFTGTNFFHVTRGQTVYSHIPPSDGGGTSEIVFEAPNNRTTFHVLSDEYLILQDRVGKFIYRLIDDNTAGEFVHEIICPNCGESLALGHRRCEL